MAESIPETDFGTSNSRLRLGALGFFFLGLFILALGIGLFFFKNSSSESDIQIISSSEKNEGDLPAHSGLSSGSKTDRQVVVHVDGAVAKPGVYKLADGSRVADAVGAAGGLTTEADGVRINLAAKVADGQKIYIARVGESVSQSAGGSVAGVSGSLVNINTASESELDKLPGVGPVTVQKIVASRPYGSLEELLTKKVVTGSVFEKIKALVTY